MALPAAYQCVGEEIFEHMKGFEDCQELMAEMSRLYPRRVGKTVRLRNPDGTSDVHFLGPRGAEDE